MKFREQYDYRGRADKGAWLVLDEAEEQPVRLLVYGKDSGQWQQQLNKWAFRRAQHRKRFNAELELSYEEQQQVNRESAVPLVGGWESGAKRVMDAHGKPKLPLEWDWSEAQPWIEIEEGQCWPCTAENVLRLFELLPEVYEMVDTFSSDRKNYPPNADIQTARLRTNEDFTREIEKNSSPEPSGGSAHPAPSGHAISNV